jgi:hypothetical protein
MGWRPATIQQEKRRNAAHPGRFANSVAPPYSRSVWSAPYSGALLHHLNSYGAFSELEDGPGFWNHETDIAGPVAAITESELGVVG